MAQYSWPPVSFSGNSNPSVGANGDVIPTSSTQVGGSDGTDLRPVKVETDGTLNVVLHGTSPITGAVTITSGTISQLVAGTISQISQGTVTISGTPGIVVSSGTVNQVGTVALVSSIAAGTVTISGTPAIVVASGTISSLATGTVTINGGTVSSLSSGTVTINAGTLASLSSGTVTINAGTLASLTSGTVTISGTPAISGTVNVKATTPTAGTITQAAVTVGTAAVQCTVSGSAPAAARSVLVVTPDNTSTAKFYIGSSSVTPTSTTRGVQLTGGQTFVANNDAGAYYICSDTAAQTVYIMEQA